MVLRDRDTTGDGTLDERLYAVQDANWNVTALAESGGSIAQRYCYGAYGSPTPLGAAFTVQGSSLLDWEHLYTGRRRDGQIGLMNYRTRYYDASSGRFIGRDPIGYRAGDANTYRYCGGNPTARTDRFGTDWLDSYSNWFNGVFGSGYSNAVGGAIYSGVVGSGLVSNETLANASANELAAVTAVAVTGAVVAGAAGVGTAIAIGSSEVGAELVVSAASPFLAAGAMTYEAALAAATAAVIADPWFWQSLQEFLDPGASASLASAMGSVRDNIVLPFLTDLWSWLNETTPDDSGSGDDGCGGQPLEWNGYYL